MKGILNMKTKRVPTDYAYTRKQKRAIAKRNMEKAGKKQFCKHGYDIFTLGCLKEERRTSSYFAEHWREFVHVKGA